MEAKYIVGDIVYVQGKVLTVEEQEDDVRYSVATSIAKYFCTAKDDVIRKSADSKGMIDVTFEEGREAYYDALQKIAVMTEEQLQECFGVQIHSLTDLILSDDYEYDSIIDAYLEWWDTLQTNVNDIVEYTKDGITHTCVVMKVRLYSVDESGNADYEDVDPESLDPSAIYGLSYMLYDPIEQFVYTETSLENIVNTGKKFDIQAYIDIISEQFANTDGVNLGMFDIDENEVTSEDDPDFIDDEYEEDDIDEEEEPEDDDEEGEEDGD